MIVDLSTRLISCSWVQTNMSICSRCVYIYDILVYSLNDLMLYLNYLYLTDALRF